MAIEVGDSILKKFPPLPKQEPFHYADMGLSKKDGKYFITFNNKADTTHAQNCTNVVAFKEPPNADIKATKKDTVRKLNLRKLAK